MLFNASQRKGIIIILLLITGIFVIPRHFLTRDEYYYLLPEVEDPEKDTVIFLPSSSSEQNPKYRKNKILRSLELNTADSITLVKVRGIGPYYARKILRYRERLGGYYSAEQLQELKLTYFHPDSCGYVLTSDPRLIRQQDLDTMSFKGMLRHPYLEYEDVQLIFNTKRKYGHISYHLLEEKKVLLPQKLKKIKPYFK